MTTEYIKPSRIKYQSGKHRRCKVESRRQTKQIRRISDSFNTKNPKQWLQGEFWGSMETPRDSETHG